MVNGLVASTGENLYSIKSETAGMGHGGGAYRILVRKREGKGSLGRTRRRLVDNIKMNLTSIGRA